MMKIAKRIALFVPLLLLIPASAEPVPAILSSELINPNAPYPECHASTIVETRTGTLVAAWFGGTMEQNPDVCIYVSRFEEGHWSAGIEVANGVQADGSRLPAWNPVLFAPKDAPLHLFYKIGPSPEQWWGMLVTSADGGKSWSKPRRLPKGILGPIKNKPVVLADGTWLSPSSSEDSKEGWRVHFERSTDQGLTWEKIGPVKNGPNFDAIQPSILFQPGGKLQALCRSKQGVIVQTWSKDNGLSWSPLTAIPLPNPNSGTDAVTLKDGRQLIVYNHSAHRPDKAKGNRWPLDVAISDDGLDWHHSLTLETQPCPNGYAYPAVIQTADGKVHITYTVNRKSIKHVVLNPDALASIRGGTKS
jgi:predicted neuraminidase